MNLSLYLLLTPPLDSELVVEANRPPHTDYYRYPVAVLDSVLPGGTKAFALHQASRCPSTAETKYLPSAGNLGFAAHVVFNAMGFLLMTSCLWLLLQIAQLGLS